MAAHSKEKAVYHRDSVIHARGAHGPARGPSVMFRIVSLHEVDDSLLRLTSRDVDKAIEYPHAVVSVEGHDLIEGMQCHPGEGGGGGGVQWPCFGEFLFY